uniref:EB domain-containing protein n=1 Tax=Parastrongyloides trichosuri TaxID=131310 RepID=A0A0N4ZGE0_PARTI
MVSINFLVVFVVLFVLSTLSEGKHTTCEGNFTEVNEGVTPTSNYCDDVNQDDCLSHINWPNCMCTGDKAINMKCQCVLKSECYKETCGVNFVNADSGIDSSQICTGVDSQKCYSGANLINCNCKDNHSLNSRCKCVPKSECEK